MKTLRKTSLGGLVAVAAVLALGGVASAQTVTIGYTPSDWDPSDFHGMFGAGIEQGLQEAGVDYEFLIRAPGGHTAHEEQLAIVEAMIAEGVDYIVINPTDYEVQRAAYERVIAAGIPLIVGNYRDPFPDDWGIQATMFSGYSHEDAGEAMAVYLADRYPEGTNVAIIHGFPGYTTYARAPEERLAEVGMNVIYTEHADFDRLKAYDAMERIIVAYPDTQVVLTTSSAMAVGAVEAAVANGAAEDIDIFGSGGTFEELNYIESGVLAGAWIRNPVEMGAAVGHAIHLHQTGRADEIELVYDAPIYVIDSVETINAHVAPVIYESNGLEFPRPAQ